MFHGADTGQLQDFAQRLGESSGRTSELLDEATTWRLSRSKPAGLEMERYLLIDDGDPATVWVATCPALDAVAGNGWRA